MSRALNGNPTVDPALTERVKEAAAELDCTPSPVARSLVLGRTQTVAVVVPDLGNPTFQAILRGLSPAAAAVPASELGMQAWARLRELLEGTEPGHPLTVLPELTIRGTTGPAPS